MDSREAKGMQIAASMPVRRDANGWIVPSQTGAGSYRVVPHPTTTYKVAQGIAPSLLPRNVQPWACTCPDFELRNQPCKHVIAVLYVVRREGIDGAIVTEEGKGTYTQDWTKYNAAQCVEKDMLLPMLADLCATIPNEPQSGRGRPRLPRSDMAYAAVAKI